MGYNDRMDEERDRASENPSRFVVGETYYQFEIPLRADGDEPQVATWKYLGHNKKVYSSTSCEVPYHFHEFVRASIIEPTDNDILLIPSLMQARESMFTWREFASIVREMSNENGIPESP